MLDAYKKKKGDSSDYAAKFLRLMEQRKVQSTVPHELLGGSCLLCSEDAPEFCHRRLVAEYLQQIQGGEIIHL